MKMEKKHKQGMKHCWDIRMRFFRLDLLGKRILSFTAFDFIESFWEINAKAWLTEANLGSNFKYLTSRWYKKSSIYLINCSIRGRYRKVLVVGSLEGLPQSFFASMLFISSWKLRIKNALQLHPSSTVSMRHKYFPNTDNVDNRKTHPKTPKIPNSIKKVLYDILLSVCVFYLRDQLSRRLCIMKTDRRNYFELVVHT